MRYVAEQYWLWIVVALVLGLTVGWVAARQPNAARGGGWVQSYVALVVAGAAVVYAGWVGGLPGLWLETAVLLGAAYLAGCIVGGLIAPATALPASEAAPPNP